MPANLARHQNSPNLAFWKMLKIGNDHFETHISNLKMEVCNRLYAFDAHPPADLTHLRDSARLHEKEPFEAV